MKRAAHETTTKAIAKRALRATGGILPLTAQLKIVRGRPSLTWLIQPNQRVHYKNYLNQFTIEADTSSLIERHMLSGTYEPHLLKIVRQYVQPGDTCLDIGANVGAMTLALAQCAGPNGCIYSFEPAPHFFQRLRRNIELNPLFAQTIHPHNIALGVAPGELHWHQSSADQGNGRLLDRASNNSIAVPVTTLDKWAAQTPLPRLDFIKMDVERMELYVAQGGLQTLTKHKPIILFETLPCRGNTKLEQPQRELLNLLRDLGYTLRGVSRTGLVRFADLPSTFETLAVPKK